MNERKRQSSTEVQGYLKVVIDDDDEDVVSPKIFKEMENPADEPQNDLRKVGEDIDTGTSPDVSSTESDNLDKQFENFVFLKNKLKNCENRLADDIELKIKECIKKIEESVYVLNRFDVGFSHKEKADSSDSSRSRKNSVWPSLELVAMDLLEVAKNGQRLQQIEENLAQESNNN
ncbi:unnamed protein product [Caenorhabditis auriculariae]|uniref:Uncharacterized protein n=1 Tax=Caenorhabditis auriculariae TaxID=2777116 RepID=A0A8S1HVR9_9PELO|nr:unnamed protein product [Caenorhabditis auriculariae]